MTKFGQRAQGAQGGRTMHRAERSARATAWLASRSSDIN